MPSAQINLLSLLRIRGLCLQVKGLQFNPQSPHLLASAGADGELAIWDLTDPRQPKQYPPLKVGVTLSPQSHLCFVPFLPACSMPLLCSGSVCLRAQPCSRKHHQSGTVHHPQCFPGI